MHISFRFRFEIELKMEKIMYKAEILNEILVCTQLRWWNIEIYINIEDIMNRWCEKWLNKNIKDIFKFFLVYCVDNARWKIN